MDTPRQNGSSSPSWDSTPAPLPGRRALWKKILLASGLLCFVATISVGAVLVHYYLRYSRIIDARLDGNVFANPAVILAAPREVQVGQKVTAAAVAAHLRKAGYIEGREDANMGSYRVRDNWLEIQPGSGSFFRSGPKPQSPARLDFSSDRIKSITALDDMRSLSTYLLEPEPLTTLFGASRWKRHLVRYQDLPKVLVNAILATEDHRFYSHHGVDSLRIVSAAINDVRARGRVQGGSTLTMQLARNLFLTPRRTIRRKLAEVCFALLLEVRLSKEQIVELYANQVYLGQRESFGIYGFGEASRVYFNKDVSALTLPEAALLAGLIRGPNVYLPYQYPGRTMERRNFVLRRMERTGFLSAEEAAQAAQAPLGLAREGVEARQDAYFVDMVKARLLAEFSERDLLSKGYRIYTTLDRDIQQAATEGAQAGIVEVDRVLKKQRERKKLSSLEPNQPQLALIALDPHTGDIKAVVGGRSYGASQLNHLSARRQPGSSFKPFVYAAALNSGVDGSQPLITPATVLQDQPTAFDFGNTPYAPRNYKGSYHGDVTVRDALTLSLNVPTVRLAEMVGYRKVRNLALAAGFNNEVGSTPSIALGSYVATPLEVAAAYTVFANGGNYLGPRFIVSVTDAAGRTVWDNPIVPHRVLDARVSYLMVGLLQNVVDRGTGAGVRSRGFKLPAAGKTGTSRDGWFAGFTPNLLAVAWVGYDDNRELNLAGSASALPVWTEFMKRTASLPIHRETRPFSQPPGIVTAEIDTQTHLIALADAIMTRKEIFIEGTQPLPQAVVDQGFSLESSRTTERGGDFPNPWRTPPRPVRSLDAVIQRPPSPPNR